MDEPGGHCWPFDRIQYFKPNFNNYTEKNYLFEGMLYQYFEGIYYERYHRREKKIT
jgi:hypothetical protein